jgi:hypothetical protein
MENNNGPVGMLTVHVEMLSFGGMSIQSSADQRLHSWR